MSSKPPLLPKQPAAVTIVGAGFTGAAIALQHLRHYAALFKDSVDLPPLIIRVIDRTGAFGPGVPVGAPDEAFLAAVLLAEKLAEELNAATADGAPVTLERLVDEISDITPHGDGITLAGKNAVTLETQALVLVTDNESVAIVATGDGLPDALGVLQDVGYKREIYAISRNVLLPWCFDRVFHKKQLPPYRPLYLDAERVKKAQDQSFAAMEWRFRLEVRRAHELGYGIGHVLDAVDFAALEKAGPHGAPPAGLRALHDIREATYGNPMQQRYALLQHYISSGRLMLLKSEAREDSFAAQGGDKARAARQEAHRRDRGVIGPRNTWT
jgi:hypothetical protein